MSNWDFGYSREQPDPRDRQYPPAPGGDGDPGPRGSARTDRPGEAGWPGSGGNQAEDGARDPYAPEATPYPLTFERDVFGGRPTWSTGPPSAEPRHAARPASPGWSGPQRHRSRQAASWQTGPESAAGERPTRAQDVPQRPGLQPEEPSAAPWRATPPPADQFGGDQYAGGQPGYVNREPGYADADLGYSGGDHGYEGRDGGYAVGQRSYLNGQPGYADSQRGYAGDQRDGPPYSAKPWSAGYSPGPFGGRDGEGMGRRKAAGRDGRFSPGRDGRFSPGSDGRSSAGRDGRSSAGTDGRSSADPMRSLYPDSQADAEPWRDDSRGPRLDGPWWDPDSWSGWRHWLIPVGVAVLAAAIGAALVLLTGMHSGPSAAVGPAHAATTASPAANRAPAP
jgi:hypothetical protein